MNFFSHTQRIYDLSHHERSVGWSVLRLVHGVRVEFKKRMWQQEMILSGRSAKMGIKSSRLYLPRHLAFYDHGPRNHSIIKTKTKILRVNPLTSLLPWFSSPPPTLWPLPCLPFFRDLPPLPTPHRQHPLSLGYPRSYFFLLFSVSHSL